MSTHPRLSLEVGQVTKAKNSGINNKKELLLIRTCCNNQLSLFSFIVIIIVVASVEIHEQS